MVNDGGLTVRSMAGPPGASEGHFWQSAFLAVGLHLHLLFDPISSIYDDSIYDDTDPAPRRCGGASQRAMPPTMSSTAFGA
jgi:hypothetical protein